METIILKPWKSWLFVNLLGGSLVINIFIWIWLNWKMSFFEASEISLHYSVEFGVDIWGDPKKLFILPVLGLSILAVNSFLSFFVWSEARLISLILTAVAFICQLIILAVIFLLLTI
jgi:hypothetical protein